MWRDKSDVSNLAGSLAFFFGLVLWATALTWVRRRFYTVGGRAVGGLAQSSVECASQ